MGDVHLGGSDEGDAHAELFRRLGPPACHRPDAALHPERDSGFGGDRRGAGDLPRGSRNRLADRLELHHAVWRSAVRLAGVRRPEPRGGCESLRVDLIRLSAPVSADDRRGYRRVGGLRDEFDHPHGGRRNEGRRLRVRGTYRESDGHPNLGLLGIHWMDRGSGGRRRLECNRGRPASVHRRAVRPELGPHHGDLYRDRDRGGDRGRLPRSTETSSPPATLHPAPAGPTGPAAVAAGTSPSLDLENPHGVARGRGFPPERPRYGIGPGRVRTEAFRLLRSRSKIFCGLEDAPRIALADALRFLELALRAERAIRPARDESRDEGTCRLVPTSLLSGREADRGPFRELPTAGTGGVGVLDLATTPARSGQDAIPQGQEEYLAVVERRIVWDACVLLSPVPTGGVADLVALHPGGVVTNNPFENPQEVVDSAGPHQHGRVFGSAPVVD